MTKSNPTNAQLYAENVDLKRRLQTLEQTLMRNAQKLARNTIDPTHSLLDALPEALFFKDQKRRYTYVNPALAALFKMECSQFYGQTDESLFGKEISPQTLNQERETLAGEKTGETLELVIENRSLSLQITRVPLKDETGQVFGIGGYVAQLPGTDTEIAHWRASSAKHILMLDSIQDPILALNKKQEVLFCNRAYADLLNMTVKKIIGHSLKQVVPAAAYQSLMSACEKITETGSPTEIEAAWGEQVFLIRANPVPWGILAIHANITERKRTEKALQESEKKYRVLVDNALAGIYITQKHQIKFCNQRFAEIFGYAQPSELIGKHVQELVVPAYWELVDREVKLRETGRKESSRYEFKCLKKDGRTVDLEVLGRRIIYNDQPAIQGMLLDISERKQAESALRESEARFRRMADNIQDGLTIIEGGQIKYVNDRACEIFGYSRAELVQKTGLTLAAPEEKARLESLINAYVKKKTEFKELDYWIVRPDGARRYIHNRYSLSTSGDQIIGRYVITTDITEQKMVQEALQRRDEILSALTSATQRLLRSKNLDQAIQKLLALLGKAAGVSRVYIFENELDEFDTVLMTQRYEWNAPGITPQLPNPKLQHLSYIEGGFERGLTLFPRGEIIYGLVADFPASEQRMLTPQQIKSLVMVPIFVEGRWWGFMGFDDCVAPRIWSIAEIEAIKIAAETIGSTLERMNMEIALRNSEERYRTLQNNIPEGIFRITPDAKILSMNRALVKMMGYESEASLIASINITELFEPEVRSRLIYEINSRGWITDFECKIKRHDQAEFWISLSVNAITDEQGHFLYYDGIARDITEPRQVAAALRESEERYRQLINHAPLGIFAADAQGNIQIVNPALVEIVGSPSIDATRAINLLSFPLLKEAGFPDLVKQYVEKGLLYRGEFPYRSKLGKDLVCMLNLYPLYDAQHQIRGMQGIVEDITPRKAVEAELHKHREHLEELVKRRTAELEEVNAELKTFAYSVSHDLRTPLRAMHGFSQILLDEYATQLDLTGQDYAKRIVDAAHRMESLIQDLLVYSRLTQAEIHLRQVNLNQIVTKILAEMESEISDRHAVIQVQKPFPVIRAHAATLEQILSNLLNNALKFVEPGKTPRVKIWADEQPDRVRIWISDNGIGIPAEYYERIFRVFERLHGYSTYSGSGIGLAIVRKAVERIGGTVGVVSEVGVGSQFWIELPK
ncbi:PAS domain S-box protein [candidate division KSB1 bacterium]|nr:PAS domain S-box protein [candidate division KSB1 bacterium]